MPGAEGMGFFLLIPADRDSFGGQTADKHMPGPIENETWLIDIGDVVIRKKAGSGAASLLVWENLVYCLWVADYGMRNAGDLESAADLYAEFHAKGSRLASELELPLTTATFALSKQELADQYFDRFDSICEELKQARPATAVETRVRRTKRCT
jgi:hypothetical protein